MTTIKGVFLDRDSLGQDLAMTPLQDLPVEWTFYPSTKPEQTLQRCEGADVVITNKVVLDKAMINQLPQLKLICVAATGINNIDTKAAEQADIKVKNVANYAGTSIAQLVFTLLLELSTNANRYHRRVQQGHWSKSPFFCLLDFPMQELAGKTIGLIGYGQLAKSVEKIALAFDMRVIIAEHKRASKIRENRVEFNTVLQTADVLSIHCPLTASTENLISDTEFTLMKSNCILINTARGGIVDEPALLRALKEKQIAAAATDVLTQEPPSAEHIMLQQSLDNLIITPHVAWASFEARSRLLDQLVINTREGLGLSV